MSQKVNIKKLNPDACIPTYGTEFSAGADLYSGMPEAVTVMPGGEIIVALHNHSDNPVTIEPKDRIAQIVLAPYITADFNEVEELDDTERGEGGFGSTGTK